MPTRRQHINNIAAQLELQKAEAYKLIDDLALLVECSISISISVEALKLAEDKANTSWNQTRSSRPPSSPSSLAISLQVSLIAQQAHCTALCQPHQRAQDIMLSEAPLEYENKTQGNHKRPKLFTSNTKPLLLIASKQRKLKYWKYIPEDH